MPRKQWRTRGFCVTPENDRLIAELKRLTGLRSTSEVVRAGLAALHREQVALARGAVHAVTT